MIILHVPHVLDFNALLGFPSKSAKNGISNIHTSRIGICMSTLGPQIHNIEYLSEDVEGVQKRAVKIILGEKFVDYKSTLESLNA